MADSIGSSAHSPIVSVVFAGLTIAAAIRSGILAMPKSSDAGAAYDFDPRAARLAAAGEGKASKLDPDAVIAQALAEKKLQDAAAALKEVAAAGRANNKPARKTFGRRVA